MKAKMFSVVLAAVLLVGTVAAPATAQTEPEPVSLECQWRNAVKAWKIARVDYKQAEAAYADRKYEWNVEVWKGGDWVNPAKDIRRTIWTRPGMT